MRLQVLVSKTHVFIRDRDLHGREVERSDASGNTQRHTDRVRVHVTCNAVERFAERQRRRACAMLHNLCRIEQVKKLILRLLLSLNRSVQLGTV